jgi:disulfide bond formation protein DsbB
MYPLVVIFGSALLTEDHSHHKYSVPLLVGGFAVAIYHNLLYYGIIPQELVPCTGTVSCSSKQLELFDFVTIPLLSLVGFSAMTVLTMREYFLHRSLRRKKNEK